MTQVGVFGGLRYTERENGWALDFGCNLGKYQILSAAHDPNNDNRRAATLNDMNRTLSTKKIDYRVPDIPYGGESLYAVQDVFEEFGRQDLAPQLPFVLIGSAFAFIEARNNLQSAKFDYARGLAYERLESLLWLCEDTQVQLDDLFNRLNNCTGILDVRRLLRGLHTHMTILMVLADPADEGRLRLLREEKALKDALQSATNAGSFRFVTLPSCRPRDLASGIRRNRPSFIHFSGHSSKGGIYFENDNGNAVMVEPSKLAPLLALAAEDGLKGVVMNGCHTKEQAAVIAAEVGHVIAMEGSLGDTEAIDFSSQFYAAIGDGCEFQKAFAWAKAGCGLSASTDLLNPILIRSPIIMGARKRFKWVQPASTTQAASKGKEAATGSNTTSSQENGVVSPLGMEFIAYTGLDARAAPTQVESPAKYRVEQQQHQNQNQQPFDLEEFLKRPPVRQPTSIRDSEEIDEESRLIQEAILQLVLASPVTGFAPNGVGNGETAGSSAFSNLSNLIQANSAAAAPAAIAAVGGEVGGGGASQKEVPRVPPKKVDLRAGVPRPGDKTTDDIPGLNTLSMSSSSVED